MNWVWECDSYLNNVEQHYNVLIKYCGDIALDDYRLHLRHNLLRGLSKRGVGSKNPTKNLHRSQWHLQIVLCSGLLLQAYQTSNASCC